MYVCTYVCTLYVYRCMHVCMYIYMYYAYTYKNVLHQLNCFNYIALLAPIDGDICQVYTMSCSGPP